MTDNKYFLYFVIIVKYFFLLRIFPDLELTRYNNFFELCNNFVNYINPYKQISTLESGYLTFPYSNLMYFVLLPFYLFSSLFDISFVNLSYLLFEVVLIFLLQKIFNVSISNIYFILIFNPLIIFSVGFLGQLDFIPLTFFLISLYFLRENNKYISILFLTLAFSSKVIFIILLPIIVLYFLKLDETILENLKTLCYSLIVGSLFNIQLFFDTDYLDTVLYGINRGYNVVSVSSSIFSNSVLFLVIFLSFTFFMYWQNIHRLDFIGVCIFTGFMTFPIYMSNLSNIGWLLWSFPSFVILFYSYKLLIQLLIYFFFLLPVITNMEFKNLVINRNSIEIIQYMIYLFSLLILYYMYEVLTKNIYFRIKSSPVVVAIAGDSAVGKSTLTSLLNKYFGNKFVDQVELDSFHKFERDNPAWNENTHLNPAMNELVEFKNTIQNLISGKTEIIRNYNHLNGKFDTSTKKTIKNFLIIEGLHALYFEDLNKKFDLNIFLDLEENLKQDTKINRDIQRNKPEEEILDEINKRKQDFSDYVLPQSNSCDLYIKTKLREREYIELNIFFKNDYFYEFKSFFANMESIKIMNENYNEGLYEFDLKVFESDSIDFFYIMTQNINNLHSLSFDVNSLKQEDFELVYKLGIILFMLNKKIENKI